MANWRPRASSPRAAPAGVLATVAALSAGTPHAASWGGSEANAPAAGGPDGAPGTAFGVGCGACGACGASSPYPLQMGVVLKLVCQGLYDRRKPVRHFLRRASGDIRVFALISRQNAESPGGSIPPGPMATARWYAVPFPASPT